MPKSFEDEIKKVEKSIEAMESGRLSLEESLKVFEEGIRAVRECQRYLEASDQQVSILLGETPNAEPELRPFLDDSEKEAPRG